MEKIKRPREVLTDVPVLTGEQMGQGALLAVLGGDGSQNTIVIMNKSG